MASEAGGVWRREEAVASVEGLDLLALDSWRHEAHGTHAVIANVPGPVCSVAMFFATEAHDDKGLPHCLEHLCFMGSKKYPRGYLDLLAARCGCEGTNAYTECDHTCYTFQAAGETGLLAVLPVFVDHVLCPLLTEDAFLTEVYHVNGKGERQGVVYNEMLGTMSEESEVLDLERRRATFGEESPYGHEHGGLPDLIMQLTPKEVADYHHKVYTTDNLHVVVCGTVDEGRLLSMLNEALDSAVANGAGQCCEQRPFIAALPKLPSNSARRRVVSFPSEDVSLGSVAYSHQLDGIACNDHHSLMAMECLGRYLTELASSPLEQAFVQCEPPVANGVTCEVDITAEPHVAIEFTGVPFRASAEELAAAAKMSDEGDEEDEDQHGDDASDDEEGGDEEEGHAVDDQSDSDEACEGDQKDEKRHEDKCEPDWFEGEALMKRLMKELCGVRDALRDSDAATLAELRRAVKKEWVARREAFEEDPNECLHQALYPGLIFDRYPNEATRNKNMTDKALEAVPARVAALKSLSEMPSQWWAELLDAQLVRPLVSTYEGQTGGTAEVRCQPSALLARQGERREEKAAKQNSKTLGKKALKALQERVDSAERANQIDISEEQQQGFPAPVMPDCVPDLPWSMRLSEPTEGMLLELLEVELPSAFVELRLAWCLDDKALPGRRGAELRRYLGVFADLLCETNVGGEDYRSVVARLDDELVSYGASVGRGSEFLQIGTHPYWLNLYLSAETTQITQLVGWADRLVYECDFSEEKVLASCRRTLSELKESMREGETVLAQLMSTAVHGPLSPQVLLGALAQRQFLEHCCADIAGTVKALRELRDIVGAPTTACAATVSGRCEGHRNAVKDALRHAWRARHDLTRPSLLRDAEWGAGAQPTGAPLLPLRLFVVGLAGADTAHIQLRVALPWPPLALDAKKAWSLRLLCEALSMMEGPLSTTVRGKGLAYGASVGFSQYENAVTLDIWECSNVRKGVESALAVVRNSFEGDGLSDFQLDNARGSLVFQLKGKRASPTNVVDAALTAATRGQFNVEEVQRWENELCSVTREDVAMAHGTCLMRLCDPSQVLACVVCDPGDCKAKAKGLAASLGVHTATVKVKEKMADGYRIVDDRTGDICLSQNVTHAAAAIGRQASVVLADGGFGVATGVGGEHRENLQELAAGRILLAEVLLMLETICAGGLFVCKLFDTFTHLTAGLIFVVAALFEETVVVKPRSSRAVNSERYLVGRRFQGGRNDALLDALLQAVQKVHEAWPAPGNVDFWQGSAPYSIIEPEILASALTFQQSLREMASYICRRQTLALRAVIDRALEMRAGESGAGRFATSAPRAGGTKRQRRGHNKIVSPAAGTGNGNGGVALASRGCDAASAPTSETTS